MNTEHCQVVKETRSVMVEKVFTNYKCTVCGTTFDSRFNVNAHFATDKHKMAVRVFEIEGNLCPAQHQFQPEIAELMGMVRELLKIKP